MSDQPNLESPTETLKEVPRWFDDKDGEFETVLERGLRVLCYASTAWALGDSVQDAHEKLQKPKQCIFYLCGPSTRVDSHGGFRWQANEGNPIEIGRFGFPKPKVAKVAKAPKKGTKKS